MSDTFKSLEKQFYSDGYRLAMNAVQDGYSHESLASAVREMHRMVDEVIVYFSEYAVKQNQPADCKKGCSWCCCQPVFALSYELDSLHEFLKKNYTEQELEKIYTRSAAKRDKLNGLQGESLLNSKFACPLLENDQCMAYSARPVACRIYLSSDVNSCKRFYDEPDSRDAVPALMEFPMRMGRIINEGFRAALKASGVKVQEFRIEEFSEIGKL